VERIDYLDLIRKNRRSSWFLLFATFTLLTVVALGVNEYLGGGWIVAVIAVVVSFGLTWTSYVKSDQIALQSTHAVPADPIQFAQLHNLVESMALSAGMPTPAVYVVNDPAPNAFATGHNAAHATVAVTTGLLQKMNRDELEGVLAHELSHIKNEDMRVMTIAVATAGSIALITDIFWRLLFFGGGRRRGNDRDNGTNILALVGLVVVLVLAPIAAAMLKASLSRKREAMADATAVQLTRYPTGLRRALEKLYADSTVVQHTSHATAHLWIEQPNETAPGSAGSKFNSMFDTHPPLIDRINLLRAIEGLEPFTDVEPGVRADLDRRSALPAPVATHDPVPSSHDATGGYRGNDTPAAASMDFTHLGQSPAAANPAATTVGGPAPAATAAVPAGWYADPAGTARLVRYWDGRRWTDHTATR
jgi:heat shock protein HtpX